MSKITIDNITGSFASVNQLNNRFQQIEDELNDSVLYRDNPEGEPNQLDNDLDLATNNVLNGGSASFEAVAVDGVLLLPGDVAAAPDAVNVSYDNSTSGLSAIQVQAAVDEVEGRLDTTESGITAVTSTANAVDTRVGSTGSDMGTYSGSLITDNETAKQNIQQLETAVEANTSAINSSVGGLVNTLQFRCTNDEEVVLTEAGIVTDTTQAVQMSLSTQTMEFATTIASGTGNRAVAISPSTWYYLVAVSEADGSNPKLAFDTDITGANALTEWSSYTGNTYDKYRVVMAAYCDASSDIEYFEQFDDHVYYNSAIAASVSKPTTPTLLTITTPVGLKCKALLNHHMTITSGGPYTRTLYATAGSLQAETEQHSFIGETAGATRAASLNFDLFTDTSSRISYYYNSSSNMTGTILVKGFVFPRNQI